MDVLEYLAHLKPDSPEFLKIREILYTDLYKQMNLEEIPKDVAKSIIDSRVYDSPVRLAILLLLGKD
jgi:acid phosphatase class B